MDHYAEEIIAIAWDDSRDTVKREGKSDLCNHAWINRSRQKVDTLKFLMAKLHPKKYGDKLPEQQQAQADHELKISWQQKPNLIERVILEGDAATKNLKGRITELDAQLAEARGETPPQPPKLLTFDPGPLPCRKDGEVVTRVVDFIKQKMPGADQRNPQAVLDELMSRISKAWDDLYGAQADHEPIGDTGRNRAPPATYLSPKNDRMAAIITTWPTR